MKASFQSVSLARHSRRAFLLLCGAALAGCSAINAVSGPGAVSASNSNSNQENKPMSPQPLTPVTPPSGKEIATIAGGCFWCTEAIFTELKGVDKVESGYAGGQVANPSYKEVCGEGTGHAEAIQITYDPKTISYADILKIFLTTHDPTTLNRQGNDVGTSYRSAIFTHNDEQAHVAKEVIGEITKEGVYSNPIVTEVTPFTNFYKAEDYHQEYYKLHGNEGYCQIVIAPKVSKFRQKYQEKLIKAQ